MNAAWWDVVVGGVAVVVAVITTWLTLHFRRVDRANQEKAAIIRFVRETERRRPLWNYSCRTSPVLSYRSIQDFRKEVAAARVLVPPGTQAAADLDVMKRAAELFSDRYEELARRRAKGIWRRERPVDEEQLGSLLTALQSTTVPALEHLREHYGIPAGQRPSDNLLADDGKETGVRSDK
jgi:hypothetical protein